jgi:hypothetical protein
MVVIRAKITSWMRSKLIDLHPKSSEVIRTRMIRIIRIASETIIRIIRNHPKSSEVHPANHPNPSSLVYRLRKVRMADGSDDQDRILDLGLGCSLVKKVRND